MVLTAHGNTSKLYDAVFSPNGSLLAATGADRVLRLWRVKD
jgi:WD40 repeat protein